MEMGNNEVIFDRNKYIGSSDISVIMGHNKYKTRYELWLEKTGKKEPEKTNYAMMHGQALEPQARDHYMKETDIPLISNRFFSDEWKHATAQVDGITIDNKHLCEFKCPISKALYNKALNKEIDDMYFDQMQWQAFNNPLLESMDFCVYVSEDECVWFPIVIDREYQKKMLKEAQKFWHLIETDTAPELTPQDYLYVNELQDNDILFKCQALKQEEDKAKHAREKLENTIKEKYKSQKVNFTLADAKLNWISKKGSVDWKEVQKKWQITEDELEKYRKENTEYATITYR